MLTIYFFPLPGKTKMARPIVLTFGNQSFLHFDHEVYCLATSDVIRLWDGRQ